MYDDIAEALRDVVRTERRALEELDAAAAEARDDGDERRADLTAQTAATKNLQLDMLPPDLAGQFKALDNYDFESDEARQQFTELAEQLREQLMQQFLDRMAGAVNDATDGDTSEEMQRLKDMLAEAQRHAGPGGPAAKSPTSRGSWSATATSSPRTPRPSTSSSR